MEALAVLVVLVVLAVLGMAISAAADARHAIEYRGNRLGPANTLAVALLADYTDEETGVRGYIVTQDPSLPRPRTAWRRTRLPGRYDALSGLLRDEPELLARLDRARHDHEAWVRNIAERRDRRRHARGLRRRRSGSNAPIRGGCGSTSSVPACPTCRAASGRARRRESRRIRSAQDVPCSPPSSPPSCSSSRWPRAATVGVSRGLIRPFNRVRRAVDAVAAGDLQTEVPSTGPREVAELGASVETMRARLVASLDDSRRAVEALTQQGPAVIALRDALAPTRTTSHGLSSSVGSTRPRAYSRATGTTPSTCRADAWV